jgi:hypothetical protein
MKSRISVFVESQEAMAALPRLITAAAAIKWQVFG